MSEFVKNKGDAFIAHMNNKLNPHEVAVDGVTIGGGGTASDPFAVIDGVFLEAVSVDGTTITGSGVATDPIKIINKADGKSYVNVDGAWVELTVRQEKTLLTSGSVEMSRRLEIDLSTYTGYSQFMLRPKNMYAWNSTSSVNEYFSPVMTIFDEISNAWYTTTKYYQLGWYKDSENSPYFAASVSNTAAGWSLQLTRINTKAANIPEPIDPTLEMYFAGFNSIEKLPLYKTTVFIQPDNKAATFGIYTCEYAGSMCNLTIGDIKAIKISLDTGDNAKLMNFDWELWGIV